MLKVWVGLEARSFLQASVDTVSSQIWVLCANTNIIRLNDASSTINSRQTYDLAVRIGEHTRAHLD
jgi:hypothetical protein